MHLLCSEDLELLRHFGVLVPCIKAHSYVLKISNIPEMFTPRNCETPIEIRPSLTSFVRASSAQYLWQPKSLPISSEQTCQTTRQVNVPWQCIHADEMWLCRISQTEGGRQEQKTEENSARGCEKGEAWGRETHTHTHTYLQEISIKIATHILGLGVTHCRNLLWSDTTRSQLWSDKTRYLLWSDVTLNDVGLVIGLTFDFHYDYAVSFSPVVIVGH